MLALLLEFAQKGCSCLLEQPFRDKESITKGLSKTKQAAMLTEKLGLAALALDTCPLTK